MPFQKQLIKCEKTVMIHVFGLTKNFSFHFSLKFAKKRLIVIFKFNPLSANPTKWSNTLKKFVGKLLAKCLNVFDHFVGLALKGLT